MMERIQPTGHTRYRKVRLGYSGKRQYTQTKRKRHINTKVAAVGIKGLPIPFRAEPKTSLIPQIK